MNVLTLWSLNGGRFVGKTPDEESQTLRWLKGLLESNAVVPDVLCLQDFQVSLLPYLKRLPHFHFAPMTNHKIWGRRETVGLCLASQYPISEISVRYTWGDGVIRDLQGIDDENKRLEPDDTADELVLATENRVVISCVILKYSNLWQVATHHGFWTRKGITTFDQIQSTRIACAFLTERSLARGGLVFVGDCNFDKEGKVLREYKDSGGVDCFPPEIKTTLTDHHTVAKFGVKPDCVMIWPDRSGKLTYEVSKVHLDPSPGSDHQMLCCEVSRV